MMHTLLFAVLAYTATALNVEIVSDKIPLTANGSVIDFYGYNGGQDPVNHLADEQKLSGDPKNDPSSAGKPKTTWNPSSDKQWYPAGTPSAPGPQACLHLTSVYTITDIYVYLGGQAHFQTVWKASATNPWVADDVWDVAMNMGAGWHAIKIPANLKAQYITVSLMDTPNNVFNEVVLYGTSTGTGALRPPITGKKIPPSPLWRLLQTNGFSWSPYKKMEGIVGGVREYQSWAWSEGGESKNYPGYPHDQNAFECLAQGGACYDDVLRNVTSMGLPWFHDMLNVPSWFHNYTASEVNWKALTKQQLMTANASITPSAYIAVADHLWQVAARYGRQKVPVSELKLYPYKNPWSKQIPQPKVSGLNLLDWIEVFNEPNKWWKDRFTFYSVEEQAAAHSAAYDGHCASLPKTKGIKQADPSMKVAHSGLVDMQAYDRWVATKWWAEAYRKCDQGKFPAQAINTHIYCNTAYGKKTYSKTGVSPEQYGLSKEMAKYTKWRDANIPEVEVWITEYGYDTTKGSTQASYPIGSWTIEEVAGQWMLRSILGFAEVGVNQANQFMWHDTATGNPGLYATSGLTDDKFNPKAGYYYFSCMLNTLGQFTFSSGSCPYPDVCTHEYVDSHSNYAYVVWSPTANNTQYSNYKVQTPKLTGSTGYLYEPANGQLHCKSSTVTVSSGTVTLTVTENPQWVMGSPPAPSPPHPHPPSPPTPAPTPPSPPQPTPPSPPQPTPPSPPQPTPPSPGPTPPPGPVPPSPGNCTDMKPGMYCYAPTPRSGDYIVCAPAHARQYRQCPAKETCVQDGQYVKCAGAPSINPCKNRSTGQYCMEAFYPGEYKDCATQKVMKCAPGLWCTQSGSSVKCEDTL